MGAQNHRCAWRRSWFNAFHGLTLVAVYMRPKERGEYQSRWKEMEFVLMHYFVCQKLVFKRRKKLHDTQIWNMKVSFLLNAVERNYVLALSCFVLTGSQHCTTSSCPSDPTVTVRISAHACMHARTHAHTYTCIAFWFSTVQRLLYYWKQMTLGLDDVVFGSLLFPILFPLCLSRTLLLMLIPVLTLKNTQLMSTCFLVNSSG